MKALFLIGAVSMFFFMVVNIYLGVRTVDSGKMAMSIIQLVTGFMLLAISQVQD